MGDRARVDALQPGAKFTSAYGGHWTYERPHASVGVFSCVRADGRLGLFAGCAEVTLGWHERGWLEGGRQLEDRYGC